MIIASLTALTLALAAPASSCAPPLDAEQQTRAAQLAKALRDAEAHATEDPEDGVAGLRSALAAAEKDADIVARDAAASDARLYAQLALARSLLATEQRAEAVKVIDAALATANGRELPAKLFGPSLVSLHDERSAALVKGKKGTLELRCKGPCFAAIDAAPVACGDAAAAERLQLPAGSYDVVLVDQADPSRRTEQRIDLTGAATITVALDNPAAAEPGAGPRGRANRPRDTVADDGRKLPRWAGILGMAVGASAIVTGGVLVAVDGKCTDLSDPDDPPFCLDILRTKITGYAMLGIGGAALVGFAVALGIGEHRQAKARRAGDKPSAVTWQPGRGLRF